MKPVGIDLGTTYCAVAIVDGEQPEILEGDSGRLTPSAVCFDDGEPLVGTIAKNMAALRPEHYVGFVKRRMGSRDPAHITDEGVEHSPEAISAIILKHLADSAGQALGAEVHDVVITVPAYFNDAARVATKDAAEIAGLNVLRLINEPTAAGIAYGLSKDAVGTFLVYDLGGGTFDVTVLKVADGHIDVVATDGNRALGGFDFDNLLMQRVAADVADRTGLDLLDEGRLEAQLRLDCEEAKRRLSQRDKAVVRTATGEQVVATTITREEFEADTAQLLKRTEAVIEEVLEQAGLGWDRIDRTLLVGGSSRMPMVAAMIERLSGQRPKVDINPDEVVAIGAAQLAAAVEPDAGASMGLPATDPTASLVKDVTSHGMGIAAIDEQGILRNCVIIPRNSTIPCVESEEFSTVEAGQRTIDFKITEGDALELDDVEVHDISELALPPGLPDKAPLRVSMAFDVDGTIHADVFDLTSNRSLGDFHLPRPNNLSAEEKSASARLLFRGGDSR